MLPDGNCLFRALSQQLTGFEELHVVLRQLLVNFIASNPEMFRGMVISRTLEEHMEEIQKNTQWGTHVEIQAAASLFQAPVYVATDSLVQGTFEWTIFEPQEKSRLVGTGDINTLIPCLAYKQHLELCYTAGTHYDSVMPLTGDTLPPSPLDGQEYSVEISD